MDAKYPEIDVEAARAFLCIDHDSPTGLVENRNNRPAGAKRVNGQWRVKLEGSFHAPERLVWAMRHGVDPDTSEIIFVDGDRSNFRAENLAEVKAAKTPNTTLFEQVELHKKQSGWLPLRLNHVRRNFRIADASPSFLKHANGTHCTLKTGAGIWYAPVYFSRDNRPRTLTAESSRVVYTLATGEDPGPRSVAHLDGDPQNNNPDNLALKEG